MPRNNKEQDELNQTIGQEIKKARLERGLSRIQLAEKIGVTHQQLHKYESGLNRITAARLYAIANSFDLPFEIFFDKTTEEVNIKSERILLEASRNFGKIKSKKIQEAINNLIRSLI